MSDFFSSLLAKIYELFAAQNTSIATQGNNTMADNKYEPIHKPALEQETLSSLAATVQSSVDIITKYLKENNLPEPTFADIHSATLPYVPELQSAKKHLIEATSALEALTQFHRIDYILKPMYAVCSLTLRRGLRSS